jgi:G3E family GTPase
MDKIPLILLTGFLGSGKTTLLNGLLKTLELADSMVLINEFGEIALDHHLVEGATDNTVVLNNGCLCCTVRGALSRTLRSLFWQRQNKKIPKFERIIIETTGLADPAPILHELLKHPTILHDYRLAGVVTCVDAMFGGEQLSRQPEAVKQTALADVLLITKTDLASAEQVDALHSRLKALNPFSDIQKTAGRIDPHIILDNAAYNPQGKTLDAQLWLKAESYRPVRRLAGFAMRSGAQSPVRDINRHDEHIQTVSMVFERPISLSRLFTALHIIATMGNENLLRVKGIVDVEGYDKPRVIHGVQHKIFPVTTLAGWPDEKRQSKLVFIVRDLDPEFISNTLAQFIGSKKSHTGTGAVH